MKLNHSTICNPQSAIQGIYALCDTTFTPELSHMELAQQLLSGGISILQLRMKGEQNLSKVKQVAQDILSLKAQYEFIFIINDFVELAVELGADGIHVGQDDMSLSKARALVGPEMLLGYSSHSFAEAQQAEQEGADYVALGAIFPTPTKGPGHPVVGVGTLRKVVENLNVPVVAIGGINQDNFEEIAQTGVAAIAMISALTQAKNIEKAASAFVGWGERSEAQHHKKQRRTSASPNFPP